MEQAERGPERIPTKEEVMEIIGRFAEGAPVTREISDEQGLVLLEVDVKGEGPGEVTQYAYLRVGEYPSHKIKDTTIYVLHYQDGIPVGGHNIFVLKSGEWEDVK